MQKAPPTGASALQLAQIAFYFPTVPIYSEGMKRRRGYVVESNVRAMLRDAGFDEHIILQRAQLPEDLLSRAPLTLSCTEYYRLWTALEDSVGVEALPLIVARALTAESFSPAIFAALCSPNLSIAIGRIQRFKPLVAPIALHIDENAARLRLALEWLEDDPKPPATLELFELGFFVTLARIGTRERILPLRAAAPDITPLTPAFADYIGIEIEAGPAVSLTFSASDAKRPFLTANEQMWETFAPELSRRLTDLDSDAALSDRVSAVLLEYLPSGLATIEAVAEKLIMSKRTLQRKLNAEGTSFQDILKDVRKELALHYLTGSRLTATEISYLLGFEDSNSFFRAFNQWTGHTPNQLRETSMTA